MVACYLGALCSSVSHCFSEFGLEGGADGDDCLGDRQPVDTGARRGQGRQPQQVCNNAMVSWNASPCVRIFQIHKSREWVYAISKSCTEGLHSCLLDVTFLCQSELARIERCHNSVPRVQVWLDLLFGPLWTVNRVIQFWMYRYFLLANRQNSNGWQRKPQCRPLSWEVRAKRTGLILWSAQACPQCCLRSPSTAWKLLSWAALDDIFSTTPSL